MSEEQFRKLMDALIDAWFEHTKDEDSSDVFHRIFMPSLFAALDGSPQSDWLNRWYYGDEFPPSAEVKPDGQR